MSLSPVVDARVRGVVCGVALLSRALRSAEPEVKVEIVVAAVDPAPLKAALSMSQKIVGHAFVDLPNEIEVSE